MGIDTRVVIVVGYTYDEIKEVYSYRPMCGNI